MSEPSSNGATNKTVALAEAISFESVKRVLAKLDIEASLESAQSGMTSALSIFENIMGATTEEEVFEQAKAGTVAGRDFLNEPFRLKREDVEWRRSGMAEGFPFYALMRVTSMENDKEIVLNCGGVTFVAVITRLMELDAFARHEPHGKPLMLTAKAVSSGFQVLIPVPVADPNLKPPASAKKA